MERIPTPKIGNILREEFLKPPNLSAYRLAKEIHVPTSRILDILHNRRRISIETGLRLAKFFGTSERFFINLQMEIDIRNEMEEHSKELEEIHPLKDVLSV